MLADKNAEVETNFSPRSGQLHWSSLPQMRQVIKKLVCS